MSRLRPGQFLWLAASALGLALALVTLALVKPHWEARETDWMVGGALVLIACFALVQVGYQAIWRDAPDTSDVEGMLLHRIEALQENRRFLRNMGTTLDAHRHLLDENGAKSVGELVQSIETNKDVTTALDDYARKLRRDRRIKVALVWAAAVGAAILLLEAHP